MVPPVHWLAFPAMVVTPLPPKVPLARVKFPVTFRELLLVMVPPQELSMSNPAMVKGASTVAVKSLTVELLVKLTVWLGAGGRPLLLLALSLQLLSIAELAPVHWSVGGGTS